MDLLHPEKSSPFRWKVVGVCDTANVSKNSLENVLPFTAYALCNGCHALEIGHKTIKVFSEVWIHFKFSTWKVEYWKVKSENAAGTSLQDYLNWNHKCLILTMTHTWTTATPCPITINHSADMRLQPFLFFKVTQQGIHFIFFLYNVLSTLTTSTFLMNSV